MSIEITFTFDSIEQAAPFLAKLAATVEPELNLQTAGFVQPYVLAGADLDDEVEAAEVAAFHMGSARERTECRRLAAAQQQAVIKAAELADLLSNQQPMKDPFAAPAEFHNGLYKPTGAAAIQPGYLYVYKASMGSHYLAKAIVSGRDSAGHQQATLGSYLGAAARFTTPELRVSDEHLAAFGQMFGWCGICSRELTDPESQQRGIGPICWGRMQG